MAVRRRDGFNFVRRVEISIGGQRAVDGARVGGDADAPLRRVPARHRVSRPDGR